MPHTPTLGPTTDDKPESPVFVTWQVCPTCGRGPAVVFPAPRDRDPDGRPKLFCFLCCPKPDGDGKKSPAYGGAGGGKRSVERRRGGRFRRGRTRAPVLGRSHAPGPALNPADARRIRRIPVRPKSPGPRLIGPGGRFRSGMFVH